MALKINRGLFSSDFVDHHAVLGVSVDAEPKDIRKRFYKITRQLHPDYLKAKNEGERQLAQELLSKFVNPAYEKLSQPKEFKEYTLLLELKGKNLNQQQETVILTSPFSQKVASASNIAQAYHQALEELSQKQYESLSDSLEFIGQISELNMVYLMRQTETLRKPPSPTPGPSPKSLSDSTPPPTPPEDLVDKAIKRAVVFEEKGDFPRAIQELRETIQMNPKHSRIYECHSRLGNIYMNSKQSTMAKIHFRKALELNSNDEMAKAGLRRLDPTGASSSSDKSGKPGKGSDKGNNSGNSFLGSIFGKKK